MKRLGGISVVVLVALVATACSSLDPEADSGAEPEDASSGTDSASPPKDAAPTLDAARADASSRDATPLVDAEADGASADASDAVDAATPPDAAADASEAGSSDAGSDASDAGPPAPVLPIFDATENNVPYEMRASCTVSATARVGTASSCCVDSSYTTETVCETVLREEIDATTGALVVRVAPMQACTTTNVAGTCSRGGTLARCDSSGLTCPYAPSSPGGPALVEGTYTRRFVGPTAPGTPKNEYWTGCSNTSMVTVTSPTCATSPASIVSSPIVRTATFAKTGAGTFTIRRSWASNADPGYCLTPSRPPASATLSSTKFVEGSAAGGTFNARAFSCTYVLTKK